MRLGRVFSCLVVLALVGASCGGGSDEVSEPTTTSLVKNAVLTTSTSAPATTTTSVSLVEVPDLTGQTASYAQGVIDTIGLVLYLEESSDVAGDPGVIVRQLPTAGSAVTPGSLVVVTVPAPPLRVPESLELSALGAAILEEQPDLRAGEAVTTLAARLLDEPSLMGSGTSIEYNPFGLMVQFAAGSSAEEMDDALVAIGGSRIGAPFGNDNLFLVETLAEPEQAAAAMSEQSGVLSVGLDHVISVSGSVNDPRFAEQWGFEVAPGLSMEAAWDLATGSQSVVVAVIDTGIQLDHPDLVSNIWTNPGEVAGNGIDDDGNGYIDDVHGWDFYNDDSDPSDDHGHGTHVAGTIGADANNGIGVSGVAHDVQMMALKAFNSQGLTYNNSTLRALEYAMDNGVKISNHSYGGPYSSAAQESLIEEAANQGHVLIVAAGNAGSNNDIAGMFPASYPSGNIISVAALDQTGSMASFSNYGSTSVDIAAPGRDILSTLPGGTYGHMSGTSMAAPHVTGLVALMRTLNPGISPDAIREFLIGAARPDDRLRNLSVSGGNTDGQTTLQLMSGASTTTTAAPETTTTTTVPTTTTAAPETTTTAAPETTTTAAPETTTTAAPETTTTAAPETTTTESPETTTTESPETTTTESPETTTTESPETTTTTTTPVREAPISMSVEFVAGNAIVSWEQQPQLSNEFSNVFVDLLYPMGDLHTPIAYIASSSAFLLVDDNPYERYWTGEFYSEPPAVFRDQAVSAHRGVIFRVCNAYDAFFVGVDLPDDLFECISQTSDINTSQAPDTRGPFIDLVEITPTSIDPGDVVTATLRLRDISGIAEDGFYANFFLLGNPFQGSVQSVSLTEDGDETVAILQATWPAWEFGCGDFKFAIRASDSLGNQSSTETYMGYDTYPFQIEVSCAAPVFVPPDPPTGLTASTGVGEVALSWTPPTIVDGRAVTDYIVEYSTDGTTWTTFSDGESSTASGTVTGLAHSTAYTFRVSAVNATGTGTASATTSATTASVPGAPGCISFNEWGTNLLRWGRYVAGCSFSDDAGVEDHAGLGGSAISAYIIEYSSDAGATWLTFESVSQSPFLNNNVGGVLGGQEDGVYLLRVSAVNAVGTGPPSATLSVEWPQPLWIP